MRTLGDTPRPLPKSCALWTPRLRGLRFNYGAQMSTLGDTPQTPAKGLRPLDGSCLPPVIARSGAKRRSKLVA